MKQLKIIFLTLSIFLSAHGLFAASIDITEYGAKGDGKTLNTETIQKAIDIISQQGGGKVIVPNGIFVTGTLILKDNVTLFLEEGAVIKGSDKKVDYPTYRNDFKALIYSQDSKNVSVEGTGVIDGNGIAFYTKDNAPDRPILVIFDKCKNVRVQNVFLKNSAMWTLRLHKSDGVMVQGVKVYGHDNYNNDGIDIESRNVTISDCRIDTDDDAIVFKSKDSTCVVENVTVTNCVLSANCNFIKFGTESHGIFRNVSISNCVMYRASEAKHHPWQKLVWGVAKTNTGISGIALEVVDGGMLDQVAITNISMQDVQTPVFIRLGKRNKDGRKSVLKNIVISNIVATSQSFISSSITGLSDAFVENVTLRDCILNVKGGGTEADAAKEVPEVAHYYPENRMFGQMLPSYGFFIRHAKNIILDNVQLRYHTGNEERHAIICDDVAQLQIRNSMWQKPSGSLESLRIKDCPGIILRDNIELTK